ncbi:MAG: NAD(P)/FAD-dependent oxidoreductase [Leptolyngbyaceae cyanobacterium SM1_1_3]|nr:NAD(P)/FAD-dependent oxidoreductase [Leptolyngbyaceae cyanobacterium SM1_1_3]NJN03984.1 NAD(P)/FAD-dependent oxidoreductase [Leptolyngbyaceae cyanobacterium RM1_1_2]NJO11617.1 NAD(P)/FAD-dependent oxidoreductase [Leptolyngbyaceae cyanobacterium SL_1_1]
MTAVLQRSQSLTDAPDLDSRHHVVIIGGGFGGLYAAKSLANAPVKVTLIDKRNFHLFQPLLYQVATGGLSAGDISSPLRSVLSAQKNTRVLMGEVVGVDPKEQQVQLKNGEAVGYDSLIVATGVSHHYFGRDEWANIAPGMKTVEDALEVRRRIFLAFEAAEKETDPQRRKALQTFVVVGGGPTGVELAGALAELALGTLKDDFRNIDTTQTQILLVEGLDRVLPPYPAELSAQAQQSLEKLGVTVQTQSLVTNIEGDIVTIKSGDRLEQLQTCTVLWAAGVKASPLGKVLAERTGAELDRVGRVMVEPDFSVKDYPNVYVVGDLAHYAHQGDRPLPGIASVAMQQGEYIAKAIRQRLVGEAAPVFAYKDKGSMAVIGRNAAVVNIGTLQMWGFPAWIIWIFVHIYFLIEFDNKLLVMTQWAWNYFTRKRGVRLITGHDEIPAIAEQVAREMETEPIKDNAVVNV